MKYEGNVYLFIYLCSLTCYSLPLRSGYVWCIRHLTLSMEYCEILLDAMQVSGLLTFLWVAAMAESFHCIVVLFFLWSVFVVVWVTSFV